MKATQTVVDVAALVEDGQLDLDDVFDQSDWMVQAGITAYTTCVYGRHGEEPCEVEIVLETSTCYGITAFRWSQRDSGGTPERGPITLDRDEAVLAGEEYASENDEE